MINRPFIFREKSVNTENIAKNAAIYACMGCMTLTCKHNKVLSVPTEKAKRNLCKIVVAGF